MEAQHFNLRKFTKCLIMSHLTAVIIVVLVAPNFNTCAFAAEEEAIYEENFVKTKAFAVTAAFVTAESSATSTPLTEGFVAEEAKTLNFEVSLLTSADTNVKTQTNNVIYDDFEDDTNGTVAKVEAAADDCSETENGTIAEAEATVDDCLETADEASVEKLADGVEKTDGVSSSYDIERSEIELLGGLIDAEAGGCSHEEKVAVALTVCYRVDSEKWDDTIAENIYHSGQYTDPKAHPSDAAMAAAEDAARLWSLQKAGEVPSEWYLPSQYMNFFGDGKHNYFYYKDSDGNVYFYDGLPGAPLPSNIRKLYEEIVG